MKRITELDGLRAIAASVILAFHLSPASFPPGWTGVDLFFVISGYLITSILISRPVTSQALYSFYARRALRIWPIYYLGLAFMVLLNPWVPRPYSLAAFPYYLTYTQNCWFYWSSQVVPFSPAFDHTWTLALEEQYYLIWPLLVALVPRRYLPLLCLLVVSIAYLGRSGMELYFVVPVVLSPLPERVLLSRCDGFALGGLLAWLLGQSGWQRQKISWLLWSALGAASLYLASGFYEGGPAFLGLPTPSKPAPTILMVELFYFGVVGLVVFHAGHRALGVLRIRWLCWLGMISYGIYLYHYMIYWMVDGCAWTEVKPYVQPWSTRALKVAITLVVAVISWYALERPLLRLKDRFPYQSGRKDSGQASGSAA